MTKSSSTKEKLAKIFNKYGIIIILIGMCVILTILRPNFIRPQNLINVIRQMAVIGIIGMGVTFCIITGGTDLSSGSMVGMIGVIVALFAQLDGQPLIIAIVIALAAGALAGFINGTIIVKGKIPPFIATLGMYSSARGAAMLFSNGRPIGNLSEDLLFIGQGSIVGIPVPIILFVLCGVVTAFLLSKTSFGRHVYAIGGNAQAAVTCGINSNRVTVMVYTLAGFLSAIAAIILTGRVGAGSPSAGVAYEFDAITGAVIGGTSFSGGVGTIGGTMIGALVIGVLNNGMDLLSISSYWQQIVKGAVIVIAVVLDAKRNKNFV